MSIELFHVLAMTNDQTKGPWSGLDPGEGGRAPIPENQFENGAKFKGYM